MSTGTRDWAAQFAPPPPPPISRAATSAHPASDDTANLDTADVDTADVDRAASETSTVLTAAPAQTADGDAATEATDAPRLDAGGPEARDDRSAGRTPYGAGVAGVHARPQQGLARVEDPAARTPGSALRSTDEGRVGPAPTARARVAAGAAPRLSMPPHPSASDEAAARPLLDVLAGAGVAAALRAAARTDRGRAFDLAVADPGRVDLVLSLAAELAEAAEALQVIPTRGTLEGEVHLEVIHGLGDGPARQTAVWVPVEVRDAINAQRTRNDESATALFLEAFNNQYANLSRLFPRRAMSVGPMPVPKARRRTSSVARTQLWLYLNAQQRDVLDTAVEDSGAGSRSALVTRILEAELGLTPLP